MSVLVDTSVWSQALRRRTPKLSVHVEQLELLVRHGRVRMIGAIRQELLSGVKQPLQYTRLRTELRNFPDVVLDADDYEQAAAYFNTCRARGLQGSNTDFLICAVAIRRRFSVFTTDKDFEGFAASIPLRLHTF